MSHIHRAGSESFSLGAPGGSTPQSVARFRFQDMQGDHQVERMSVVIRNISAEPHGATCPSPGSQGVPITVQLWTCADASKADAETPAAGDEWVQAGADMKTNVSGTTDQFVSVRRYFEIRAVGGADFVIEMRPESGRTYDLLKF